MDRRLIFGATLLLFFELGFLAAELGWSPFIKSSTPPPSSMEVIGKLASKVHTVKRKHNNSILWSPTFQNDSLFNYDSILTLPNSSASLVLHKDINVSVQEKTLLFLEPPNRSEDGSLTIKFIRGNIHTLTNLTELNIQTGELSLTASAGADVSIRKTNSSDIEVEIRKGKVRAKGPKLEESHFSPGSIVTLSKHSQKPVIQMVDQGITWLHEPKIRHYSHNFPAKLDIKWDGVVKKLKLLNRDIELPIMDTQTEISLLEQEGTHIYQLIGENGVSNLLTIEVVKAPTIQHFFPLPRERFPINKTVEFTWSPLGDMFSYSLTFSEPKTNLPIKSSDYFVINTQKTKLDHGGSWKWSITAKDKEGFTIPPKYQYPIFILENPLAPPKIRGPANKEPSRKIESNPEKKQRSSNHRFAPLKYFLRWIFPEALAIENVPIENDREPTDSELSITTEDTEAVIIFSWYPVTGANYYIIEISSDPTFRDPEVIDKVTKHEYQWKTFDNKTYYWRVAGGQTNGRKGLFSEPSKVNLSETKSPAELAPGVRLNLVQIKKPEQPILNAPPKEIQPLPNMQKTTISENPEYPEKPTKEIPPTRPVEWENWHGKLYYITTNQFLQETSTGNVTSSLQGFTKNGGGLEVCIPYKDSGRIVSYFKAIDLNYVPENPNAVPKQDSLSSLYSEWEFYYQSGSSTWAWGLSASQNPSIQRVDLETTTLEQINSYGLATNYIWGVTDRIDLQHNLSIEWANNSAVNYKTIHRFQLLISHMRALKFSIGGQIMISVIQKDEGLQRLQTYSGFTTGISW